MPFFNVRCANCKRILSTPYFTGFESEVEIKNQMTKSKPVQITCKDCGHTATYGPTDFGLVPSEE